MYDRQSQKNQLICAISCCSNKQQPQATVQQLMNGETEGSLEGFVFDPAVCRRAFDHYDKDKSGYLDGKEIMKLADVSGSICTRLDCDMPKN